MFTVQRILVLISIPLTMSVAHSLGLYGNRYIRWCVQPLRSFAAGYSVGYVFLMLFPDLVKQGLETGIDTAVLPLLGFVLFHGAHKYVFQYKKGKNKRILLDEIHLVTAALYSFLITFSLVEITRSDMSAAFLLGSVVILHTVLSELSHTHTVEAGIGGRKMPILILATWLGGVLSLSGIMSTLVTTALFSTTAGALVYIAIREELPTDSVGRANWFILGAGGLVIVRSLLSGG